MDEKKAMTARELAESIVRVLDSKRARDIRLLHMTRENAIVDYCVLATGSSATQIRALSGEVEEKMAERGAVLDHIEGHGGGTWVLMDYSSVAVHIFSREAREFYNLDRLWSDAEQIDISSLLVDNTAVGGNE
ncbi:MAG: ribosome silencing factor [Eubacteriales bacterium]|nr:ribosome silencing factor [Eubacteriales bacterium]